MVVKQAIENCTEAGVESITCVVYDESDNRIAGGGPWNCSDHHGTLDLIPAGSNRKFTVLGWSGAEGAGNTVYQGQIAGITINPREIADAGTIDAYPFVPQLSGPADGESVDINAFALTWNSVANAARYRVLVSDDSSFATPLIDTQPTGSTYRPLDLAPLTTYYWRVTALDIHGNEGAASAAWQFTTTEVYNQIPTAAINAPETGASFLLGQTVAFQGSGEDPEDGPLSGNSLVWSSDIDGQIGTGASLETQTLSAGTHTITLTASDSDGAPGIATVNITIVAPNQAPTATISAPADNSTFYQGDMVNFSGSGNDPEDGSLSGSSLVWSSNRDGQIGTGTSFGTQSLSVGNHNITLTVTDSDGASDTDTISISITAPLNQAPTATISAPADDSTFSQGELVSFSGSGNDPEDGTLSGNSLVWSSSIDGRIGTGTAVQTQSLSVGNHTITLTVTDSDGASDTDTISISITAPPNQAPTATISAPSDNSTFSQGELVSFSGSGNDPEDGTLSGNSLVWSSSIDGRIGTGTSFGTQSLSVGNHTITLTVTDSDGASDTDTIRIAITNIIDVNIDFDFEYIAEGFPMGLSAGETAAAAIADDPVESLEEPDYGRFHFQHYSYFTMGNSQDTMISLVLNTNYEDFFEFYVDRNNNEDLTDDGGPIANQGQGVLFAAPVSLTIDIVTESGTISRPYRLWMWLDGNYNVKFYALCHYTGQLVIGGQTYTAVAFEDRNHDALYKENGLYIDLNGDETLDAETENFIDGEQLSINGTSYLLQLNYP